MVAKKSSGGTPTTCPWFCCSGSPRSRWSQGTCSPTTGSSSEEREREKGEGEGEGEGEEEPSRGRLQTQPQEASKGGPRRRRWEEGKKRPKEHKERYHEHKEKKEEKEPREPEEPKERYHDHQGKRVPPAIARPIAPPFLTPRDGSDTILGRVYKVKKELRQEEEESVGLVTAEVDKETDENGQAVAASSNASSSQAMAIKQLQVKVQRLEQQLQQAQQAGTSSTGSSSTACALGQDAIPKTRPNCKTKPKILLPPAGDMALEKQAVAFAEVPKPKPKVILFKYRSH